MNFMIKWSAILVILLHIMSAANSKLHIGVYTYHYGRYYNRMYNCDEIYQSTCIIKNFTDTDTDVAQLIFTHQYENYDQYDEYGEYGYGNHDKNEEFDEIKFIICNFSQSPTIIISTSSLFAGLGKVDLSESHIKALTKFQFQNVKTLKTLILSRNEIQNLEKPSIFNDHSTLLTIDLSFNRIQNIHPEAFDGLTKLSHLYLNNNEINEIDGQIIKCIHSLSTLDLSSNQVEFIKNNSFVGLEHLSNLYLQDNKFANFNLNDLKYNRQLVELFLGNNSDFIVLSGDFYVPDTHLESTLNLSKVIHANAIANSSFVFMTNSEITRVQLGSQVNIIDANNCSLTDLTFDYENSKLLTVDFSGNNLSGELKFDNLINLHSLDLSFNEITNISFINSSALINLNLCKNNLTNIHGLISMSELKKLDLSQNCIQNINLDTFSNMHDLEVLVLRKTCFKSVDFGTFSNKKNLKLLDISYNNLNRIDLNFFYSLSKLEDFFIDGNNLTDIQSIDSISIHLRNLHSIALSNNEWNCSTLSSIIKTLDQLKVKVFVEDFVRNKTNIKGIGCSTASLNSTQQSIIAPQNPMLVNHTVYINRIEKINEIVEKINEMNNRRKDREFSDNSLSLEILHLKNRKIEIQKKVDDQIDKLNVAVKEVLNKFKLSIEMNYNESIDLNAMVEHINDTNNEKYELLFKRIDSLRDRLRIIKLNDFPNGDESNENEKKVMNFNSKYRDDIKSIKSLEICSIIFLLLLIVLALYFAWFKC